MDYLPVDCFQSKHQEIYINIELLHGTVIKLTQCECRLSLKSGWYIRRRTYPTFKVEKSQLDPVLKLTGSTETTVG